MCLSEIFDTNSVQIVEKKASLIVLQFKRYCRVREPGRNKGSEAGWQGIVVRRDTSPSSPQHRSDHRPVDQAVGDTREPSSADLRRLAC